MFSAIVAAVVLLASSTSIWTIFEALGAVGTVAVSASIASYQLLKARGNKKMTDAEKMDRLLAEVVGRPESPDGAFARVPGLVDNFNEHREEVRAHQTKVDVDIAAINERLDYVASQYVTNGGSTVKDDLIILRAAVSDLGTKLKEIATAQEGGAK